ncbi:K4.2 [Human gammaherpesvirus 8]|nr:K4.2 [Human gammaherpesvirus 8]WPM02597.1 K4.2 [Human gammaherpesvirus 8]
MQISFAEVPGKPVGRAGFLDRGKWDRCPFYDLFSHLATSATFSGTASGFGAVSGVLPGSCAGIAWSIKPGNYNPLIPFETLMTWDIGSKNPRLTKYWTLLTTSAAPGVSPVSSCFVFGGGGRGECLASVLLLFFCVCTFGCFGKPYRCAIFWVIHKLHLATLVFIVAFGEEKRGDPWSPGLQ